MTSPLALSENARIACDDFGREGLRLVTVDDALRDVETVRAIAARHDYRPIGPHYPGIRAAVSERVAMPLVQPLLPLLQQVFALARPPSYRECYLSLVTRAPADLAPIQRLPHFDGVEATRIAVLLYLDPQGRGGTGFFRQRETGFEYVDGERLPSYEEALRRGVAEHGMPPARFIGADSALFERTLEVEDRLNRMVLYRGNTLHCAALRDDFLPDADPSTGRLSLNLFLQA